MGFCHAVWPMTHGEKVAETCGGSRSVWFLRCVYCLIVTRKGADKYALGMTTNLAQFYATLINITFALILQASHLAPWRSPVSLSLYSSHTPVHLVSDTNTVSILST
jgi:hypothetical protein